MKIQRKHIENPVSFRSILLGDVFEIENQKHYLMKTAYAGLSPNSIFLNNGSSFTVSDDQGVRLVKGTFVEGI